MLDHAFLEWLRATTEARWADASVRDAAVAGLGEPAWQPGTHWRGGLSESDLRIVEAMFSVRLPAAYRQFLASLHTPDPAMAAMQVRGGRLMRVEARLFTDWTGPTTPLIAAFEQPLDGILRGAALGRWHPAWGERPADPRERERTVRRLAAAAPQLIPFAGARYLVAEEGADDGPILAVHGADAAVVAPDLRSGLLRELGLADPAAVPTDRADASADPGAVPRDPGEVGAGSPGPARPIPFWSDVIGGIPWQLAGAGARDRP